MADIGNAEYKRLLALLKSNPNYKLMLDTISKAEGTWGKDAYSTKFGGKKVDWRNGKNRDSIPFGKKGLKTSAHGKYQWMNDTWDKHAAKLGMTGFSPEEQDVAALAELEQIKGNPLKKIDDGDFKGAIFDAGKVWMGLPINEAGDSAAKSAKYGHQKAQPLAKVMGYMQSNETARAGVNKGYLDINEKNRAELSKARDYIKRAKAYDVEWAKITGNKKLSGKEKDVQLRALNNKPENEFNQQNTNKYFDIESNFKEKQENYVKELRKINLSNLSDVEKNNQKHKIKNKYYRNGELVAIQDNLIEENKKHVLFNDRYEKLQAKIIKFNETPTEVKRKSGVVTKWAQEIEAEYKALGLKQNDRTLTTSDFDLEDLKTQMKTSVTNPYKYMETEKGLLKYGKTKEEYDAEVGATTPEDYDSSSEGGIEADIASTDATKIAADQAKSQKTADDALLAKSKPFDNAELTAKYSNDDEMLTDAQFKYTPGKREIPFDALTGLATGLMGMAQSDIEIEKRDEQIGEGMLQYAADIAKIKEMGLPPEIEGGLKMKLASAYQTGLDNIVSSSNGNRNLVLGNQGQLDQARMKGIVDIAAMDVDRRDKALAAFGEFQKYKSEFEAKTDIANSERKYKEDEKKQLAAGTLAQTGMASFIDSINHAKENGPGSVNDMRRQKYEFSMTGLLKGALPGEPGSQEYLDSAALRQKVDKDKKTTMSDFIKTKSREEQDIIFNIIKKHPEKDFTENKETSFEEFKTFFDQASGTEEFKSFYNTQKGISQLQEMNSRNEKINKEKEATAVTTPEAVPVVKQTYQEGTDPVLRSIKDEEAEKAGILNGTRTPAPLKTVPTTGMIVGTGVTPTDGKVSDNIILGGLNKEKLTGMGLTPDQINQLENDKKVRNENDIREANAKKEIAKAKQLEIERDIIFNQKQQAAKTKLELVTGKK